MLGAEEPVSSLKVEEGEYTKTDEDYTYDQVFYYFYMKSLTTSATAFDIYLAFSLCLFVVSAVHFGYLFNGPQ